MKALQLAMWIAFFVALICVGVTYAQSGSPEALLLVIPPLAFWLSGQRWQRDGLINFTFFVMMLLIAVAAFSQPNATLLITATIGIFCAWDLHAFGRRITQHNDIRHATTLFRTHIQALLTIIIITLIITLIIFNATLNIGLGWSILFGAVLVIGILQTMRFLRESDL